MIELGDNELPKSTEVSQILKKKLIAPSLKKTGKHKELIRKLLAPNLVNIAKSQTLINQVGLYLNHEENFPESTLRQIQRTKRTIKLATKEKHPAKTANYPTRSNMKGKTANNSREATMRTTKTSLVVKLPT